VLDDVWRTIVKERSNPQGYEHRAPKRRSPNATNATNANPSAQFMHAWLKSANADERKCLFNMDELE
jgi:hypothetical protein